MKGTKRQSNVAIGNFYGELIAVEQPKGDEFFLQLEDYNGMNKVKISKQFFDAFIKEFGENTDIIMASRWG